MNQEFLQQKPFVLDIGSYKTKFGLADLEKGPQVIDSLYGINQYVNYQEGKVKENIINPTEEEKCILRIENICQEGIVNDDLLMSSLLQYTYAKSDILSIEENPLIFSKRFFLPEKKQIKILELCLEENQQQALMFANSSLLSFLATGNETGVCLEMGDQVTQISCLYQGFSLSQNLMEFEFGGRKLAQEIWEIFRANGHCQNEYRNIRFFNSVLKTIGKYQEFFKEEKMIIELPDKQQIKIDEDLKQNIQHQIKSNFHNSLSSFVQTFIDSLDINIKKKVLGNFFLSGGLSNMNQLSEFLKETLIQRETTNENIQFALNSQIDRSLQSWYGGAIVSQLDFFHNKWITPWEFYEHGERILKIKEF